MDRKILCEKYEKYSKWNLFFGKKDENQSLVIQDIIVVIYIFDYSNLEGVST